MLCHYCKSQCKDKQRVEKFWALFEDNVKTENSSTIKIMRRKDVDDFQMKMNLLNKGASLTRNYEPSISLSARAIGPREKNEINQKKQVKSYFDQEVESKFTARKQNLAGERDLFFQSDLKKNFSYAYAVRSSLRQFEECYGSTQLKFSKNFRESGTREKN